MYKVNKKKEVHYFFNVKYVNIWNLKNSQLLDTIYIVHIIKNYTYIKNCAGAEKTL